MRGEGVDKGGEELKRAEERGMERVRGVGTGGETFKSGDQVNQGRV